MSQMQLFKNNNDMPSYIKGVKSNLSDLTFKGNSGGKQISIEGGVFRLIVDGEEVSRNENRSMNFVVVGMQPEPGRVFYATKYVPGETSTPTCWSSDGKVPSPTLGTPQHENCRDCPMNIKGSGERDTKACKTRRYVAVVLESDLEGDVYRLDLSPKTLFKVDGKKMGFEAYRKFLKGHGLPIDVVVTEVKFDMDESVPVLNFSAVRPLEQDEWKQCQQQGRSDACTNAVTMNFSAPAAAESSEPDVPALPAAFEKRPTFVKQAGEVEVVEEDVPPPQKRVSAKAAKESAVQPDRAADLLSKWASDDGDE